MFDKKALKNLKNELISFKEALVEFSNACEKEIPEAIAKEAALAIYEDLAELFDACIAKYYADYTPYYYSRTYSLYKVYKLQIKGTWVRWEFSPDFIPKVHRVDTIDPNYIYNWMFVKGYHGGAVGGEGHPYPGAPWYRTPPPSPTQDEKPYSRWSTRMAEYSMISPYKRIENEIKNYEQNRKTLIGRSINDAIIPAQKLVFGRYRIFNYGRKV